MSRAPFRLKPDISPSSSIPITNLPPPALANALMCLAISLSSLCRALLRSKYWLSASPVRSARPLLSTRQKSPGHTRRNRLSTSSGAAPIPSQAEAAPRPRGAAERRTRRRGYPTRPRTASGPANCSQTAAVRSRRPRRSASPCTISWHPHHHAGPLTYGSRDRPARTPSIREKGLGR